MWPSQHSTVAPERYAASLWAVRTIRSAAAVALVVIAVLGGGPGGYSAAIRAAQLGAKTVCIDREPELGGTCLRVGCIPTKAWVQTAHAIKEAEETFAKLGVNVGAPELDLATANEWKAGVVKKLTDGVAFLFKANGVEWVQGTGRFKDANTIAVEGGEDVTFKQAIGANEPLRTGSYSKTLTFTLGTTNP